MIFELMRTPYPEEYGEGLLPIEACKLHLRVTAPDEDALIAVLRDAAIEFIENFCAVRLSVVDGLIWRAEGFPSRASQPLSLGVQGVSQITAVEWMDSAGALVTGDPADFRVGLFGAVLPKVGGRWPANVGGGVKITFTAGYDVAPTVLLQAARLLLGHFYANREEMIDVGFTGEVPFGVVAICRPIRRTLI